MGNEQAQAVNPQSQNKLPPSQTKNHVAQVPKVTQSDAFKKSKIKAQSPQLLELKKGKLYASQSRSGGQLIQSDTVKFDEYTPSKMPHLKQIRVKVRNQDYSDESKQISKSQLKGEGSLSFKIDDEDGVSEQAQIYHFDYERSLNHYINWERQKSLIGSKIPQ